MAAWLALLNKLLSFGPKLPQIMASIDIIVSELQNIAQIISGGVVMAAPEESLGNIKISGQLASAEVLAAEQKVLDLCAEEGIVASDKFGGVFSNLLAFLKAHPEIVTLLLSLFGSK